LKECESFKENEFFCCASSATKKNNWRPFPLLQSGEFDFAGKHATVPVLRRKKLRLCSVSPCNAGFDSPGCGFYSDDGYVKLLLPTRLLLSQLFAL
jgi:hypothetical protein